MLSAALCHKQFESKTMRKKPSLMDLHHRRIDVPVLLLLASGLLAAGLSQPTLILT
jgi:hypothetical protein